MIDACILDHESGLLQQACDITGGIYLKIPHMPGLLQYLQVPALYFQAAREKRASESRKGRRRRQCFEGASAAKSPTWQVHCKTYRYKQCILGCAAETGAACMSHTPVYVFVVVAIGIIIVVMDTTRPPPVTQIQCNS